MIEGQVRSDPGAGDHRSTHRIVKYRVEGVGFQQCHACVAVRAAPGQAGEDRGLEGITSTHGVAYR